MKPKRAVLIGLTFLVVFGVLAVAQRLLDTRAVAEAAGVQVPLFEVDPLWPKPLPNHWLLGNTIGVSADAQDHIWIIHRAGTLEPKEVYATTDPPGASCCLPAPPILEFDQAGNLIGHWGGPGQGTNGRIPTTASRSITKVTSGLAATAGARHRRASRGTFTTA